MRLRRHSGGGRGEKVVQQTMRGSWAAVFRDNATVQRAVLSGERRRCDHGGGCSGVFIFYLHMGMGEICWREEVDHIISRIKDT